MYYRVRFKATPKEFVFEAVKQFVLVKDMMQTIKKKISKYTRMISSFTPMDEYRWTLMIALKMAELML